MPVIYDGKKIIPAPFMQVVEEFVKNEAGDIIGSLFNITLTGSIVAHKGSPNSSGTFWTSSGYPSDESIAQTGRLTALVTKQKAIQQLFGVQGKLFEVQGLDGTYPFRCNPQVLSIDFNPGVWTEYTDYIIQLQANGIIGLTSPSGALVRNTTNSWQIELSEEGESDSSPQSFRMTHTVGAQGMLVFNSDGSKVAEPWILARNWVQARLGFDSSVAQSSGVMNLPSYYGGYNHSRSESVDKETGNYSVTENWILASGTAIEDFTVNTVTSIDNGITTVSVQGNIRGLETRSANFGISTSKYAAASGKFDAISNNIFQRAQSYSNTTLNTSPVSTDIGRNPVAGVINYSYSYDNRPSNYVPGARSEIITVVDNLAGDVFASIPVLGRAAGPVLQSISTITEMSRQLTIELVLPVQSIGSDVAAIRSALNNNPRFNPTYSSYISDIITAATPVASQVFTVNPQETWDPKNGRYTYTKEWVYQ